MFWWIFGAVTCLKILLIPSYRSTDFEVHRNWMAITHTRPLSEWYFEETSEWTLDYPPFFAYFEWALSQIAQFVDPKMLLVENLNYASQATIVFQRASVICTDLVYALGARKCLKKLRTNQAQELTGGILLLANVGLLIVDHIHFQYNGFLFGIMLLSIGSILEGKNVQAALLFSALLNFKHIFLYTAPAFGAYLLKFYCANSRRPFVNFLKLLSSSVLVLALSFLPFAGHIPQLLSRLFPFKRGLTHAYWAPNFWSIYNCADKALSIIFKIRNSTGGNTGGLVQEYQHEFLPSISPLTTFVLTAFFMLPCFLKLLMFTPKRSAFEDFVRATVICSCTSFMFGWHVHEKAILMVLVPISLLATTTKYDAEQTLLLSIVGHYSLFPLLFTKELILVKYSLYLSYILAAYCCLKSIHPSLSLRAYEKLYVLGLVALTFYEYVLQFVLNLDEKLPFLPLLLTSVYCSVGVVYFYVTYYYNFLKMPSSSSSKQKTK